jgi:hypothetical protein
MSGLVPYSHSNPTLGQIEPALGAIMGHATGGPASATLPLDPLAPELLPVAPAPLEPALAPLEPGLVPLEVPVLEPLDPPVDPPEAPALAPLCPVPPTPLVVEPLPPPLAEAPLLATENALPPQESRCKDGQRYPRRSMARFSRIVPRTPSRSPRKVALSKMRAGRYPKAPARDT